MFRDANMYSVYERGWQDIKFSGEDKTMKAIHATPKEVQKIFSESYVIPDFQRPYSWEREQCETLWDDLIVFFDAIQDDQEDKYFLGNVVTHPSPGGKLAVIDGQQRLTTLLLLIKALFTRAGTAKILEGCLRIQNKLTSELTDELRISSEVIAEDRNTLTEIVLRSIPDTNKSKLAENYRFFIAKIDEWRSAHTADEFNKLIGFLLYNVVLLPIECGSEDDALTIFETINNRGMSLSDADIFKAKLYHNAPAAQQAAFIEDWTGLKNPEWLFRVYMHVLRADKGDTGKEIALRSYFSSRETLSDWEKVITSLKKIHAIDAGGYGDDEKWYTVDSLWAILNTYPNQYWNYPLYVFMHKYGTYDDETGYELETERVEELIVLLEEMIRYYFMKGVIYNAVNAVKDTTFKVCAKIVNGGDYITEYCAGITTSDKEEMSERINSNKLGRYLRGLVLLASYLNSSQDKSSFVKLVWGKYDIEHILPKKWNNYDGWTESTWESKLNTLGNLIPLEREINISASNEFFKRKKMKYSESKVQDAQDIANGVVDNGWTPQRVDKELQEKFMRLNKFFGLK